MSQMGCWLCCLGRSFLRFAELQSNDMPCQICPEPRHVAGGQHANELDALPMAPSAQASRPTPLGGPAGACARQVCASPYVLASIRFLPASFIAHQVR